MCQTSTTTIMWKCGHTTTEFVSTSYCQRAQQSRRPCQPPRMVPMGSTRRQIKCPPCRIR
ncbi:hypothetical protein KVT40_008078 [Elsinoe batatas]|uniref:Uncharacterized protein n=1 Tax=Elsinoe batatas TaxID=2601811 RepID=A0A8K0PC27_9PEZI|nr:hypothetical protein KVT40_008078 [Elsinoe batatas]